MELQNFSPELRELAFEEAIEIGGGESLWYWFAYGLTNVVKGVGEALEDAHKNPIRPSEYR